MSLKIIFIVITILIYGLCKGIKDMISFHFGKGWTKNLNPKYWNPQVSWQNKYDSKIPFATTILVWTTDAWHLFDMIQAITLTLLLTYLIGIWWYFPILWIAKQLTFKLFYK